MGGVGHWLKDLKGNGTASTLPWKHFILELCYAVPYPVHSWMLVVGQRPWPLVGKVLVRLSRNRSAQFWDTPWNRCIPELIRATAHCSMMWNDRGQNGSLQSDNFNHLEYFGWVTDCFNYLQCKIMKHSITTNLIRQSKGAKNVFLSTILQRNTSECTQVFKDLHTTVLTVHLRVGWSVNEKAWIIWGKDGWLILAAFQSSNDTNANTEAVSGYLHAKTADRYEASFFYKADVLAIQSICDKAQSSKSVIKPAAAEPRTTYRDDGHARWGAAELGPCVEVLLDLPGHGQLVLVFWHAIILGNPPAMSVLLFACMFTCDSGVLNSHWPMDDRAPARPYISGPPPPGASQRSQPRKRQHVSYNHDS